MITGEYTYSLEDFEAVLTAARRGGRHTFFRALGIGLFAVISLWAAFLVWHGLRAGLTLQRALIEDSGGHVAAAMFLGVYLFFFSRIIRWLVYVRSLDADKLITFALSDSGMTVTSPLQSSTVPWASFSEVVELQRALVPLIDRKVGHVIPRRAFANPTDFEAARKLVCDKLAQNNAAKLAAAS